MGEIIKWLGVWAAIGVGAYLALANPMAGLSDPSRKGQAMVPAAPVAETIPTEMQISLTPASTPTPTALRFLVANTDGAGVFIRRTRVDADKIKAWRDGTEMVEIGPAQQDGGQTWKNVRDPAGNAGWIQERYLVAVPVRTSRTARAPQGDPARVRLELLASKMTFGYGFVIVEGQAKNISEDPAENVAVVVSWQAADGKPVKSVEEFMEYNPLLPGQRSNFKVITGHDPSMKSYTVGFKQLFGGNIPMMDSRPSR